MSTAGFACHGHFVRLEPDESGGRWQARVLVEVHAGEATERIHYRDHPASYATREEALEASRASGKRMVESFTLPAYGEGDYREPPGA